MGRPNEVREPFFFGEESNRLFGCFHTSQLPTTRSTAVLICNPVGQEYIRCHRTLLQLAVRLTKAGFSVLRFDYSATGDSAGELESGSLQQWRKDITTAAQELRRRSRQSQVVAIGVRLGAALAGIEAATAEIGGLVAWDPVLSGSRYLEELRTAHKKMLRFAYVDADRAIEREDLTERLGYPLTATLRNELEEFDLIKKELALQKLWVVTSRKDSVAEEWADAQPEGKSQRMLVESPQIWSEEPYKGLVPNELLETIVGWLKEQYR